MGSRLKVVTFEGRSFGQLAKNKEKYTTIFNCCVVNFDNIYQPHPFTNVFNSWIMIAGAILYRTKEAVYS